MTNKFQTFKPAGKRWGKAEACWVFLHDEAPTIGSGLRPIWYIEGRKWAFIAGRMGQKKLKMAVWLTIKAESGRRLAG